jgi:hypothetical protein
MVDYKQVGISLVSLGSIYLILTGSTLSSVSRRLLEEEHTPNDAHSDDIHDENYPPTHPKFWLSLLMAICNDSSLTKHWFYSLQYVQG